MKTSALAITSLVLGILALLVCFLGPLLAIPAVICGHLALSRINRSGGELTGNGLAVGGLVTGYMSILIGGLLMIIAVPNFIKANAVAEKNRCLMNLRSIDLAKAQWAMENRKDGSAVPTEENLKPYLTNHALPHCPAGGVYSINVVHQPPGCSIPEHQLP